MTSQLLGITKDSVFELVNIYIDNETTIPAELIIQQRGRGSATFINNGRDRYSALKEVLFIFDCLILFLTHDPHRHTSRTPTSGTWVMRCFYFALCVDFCLGGGVYMHLPSLSSEFAGPQRPRSDRNERSEPTRACAG